MKKSLIILLFSLLARQLFADAGYYESFAYIEYGEFLSDITFYSLNDFDGTYIGEIGYSPLLNSTGERLFFLGGESKSFKNNGTDVTGHSLFYRIYEENSTPGSFQEISYEFQWNTGDVGAPPNLNNFGDQQWGSLVEGANTTNKNVIIEAIDYAIGTYVLEIYHVLYTNGVDAPSEIVENNGGANYKATFDVVGIFPIKLSSFGVSKNQMGESFLQWTSESECEASHYEIERSVNGLDFEKIAEVQTRGGGDNCLGSSYDLTDKIQLESVFATSVFYRLKMVDLDRSFEYSDVVAVDANRERFVFFNMNTKELLVENIEGAFTISISNINGDLILNQEMTSGTLSLNQLHKGMYFVTVMQNRMKMTEKIVIQ